jgi:hypothetical protein
VVPSTKIAADVPPCVENLIGTRWHEIDITENPNIFCEMPDWYKPGRPPTEAEGPARRGRPVTMP